MSYRMRNITAAAGLAVLAVVFMLMYISKARNGEASGKDLVKVLVAAHDIPEGTPGSSLQGGALVEKSVPRYAAVPDAVTAPGQVRAAVATQEILGGEQITTRRFGPLAANGVRSQIARRQRVVQVAGDPNQVLDGTLEPGDRVDVMATWNVPEGCVTCHVSRTIVRNALVLRTSADLSTGTGGNDTRPVQLRLSDAEAERVLWVVKNGQWWLALRPVVKPRDSRQGFDSSRSILRGGLNRKGPSR